MPGSAPRSSPAEHPAGYVQDPYAAEMTAQQRASMEAIDSGESRAGAGLGGWMAGLANVGAAAGDAITGNGGGGAGSGSGSGSGRGFGDEGATQGEKVWGAVKGFAGTIGEKAVELEEEVWRRVNGK